MKFAQTRYYGLSIALDFFLAALLARAPEKTLDNQGGENDAANTTSNAAPNYSAHIPSM